METMTTPSTITVIGRRWFDRRRGNTYHSVTVYADGEVVGREPFAYGYDRQYEQTAQEILAKAGVVTPEQYENGSEEALWRSCERLGIALVSEVSDVSRRKDL